MEIKGLSKEHILQLSEQKKEAAWVKNYRLKSYQLFESLKMPSFGPPIHLDFDSIIYYKTSEEERIQNSWDKINQRVKNELDDLGVLESESHMDGMGVQYESEVIYHNMIEELQKKDIIFTSIEDAMQKYPDLEKSYRMPIINSRL